jgi:hypothetical protein
MLHRWQVVAIVALLILPFLAAGLVGPGMGQAEVSLWLVLLLIITAGPAAARSVRRIVRRASSVR